MKILHQVWVQGESDLPSDFQKNRALWREKLPQEWEMRLWDDGAAKAEWEDYREVADSCPNHAMRADLILARALRDYGGIATGTDVVPNNIDNLMLWTECNDSMVILNPGGGAASNGLSYFREPNHPFIKCVCLHQLRNGNDLSGAHVWGETGPGCWNAAIRAHMWNLSIATDRRAYTKLYSEKEVGNPDAWVDAGYAGSWH